MNLDQPPQRGLWSAEGNPNIPCNVTWSCEEQRRKVNYISAMGMGPELPPGDLQSWRSEADALEVRAFLGVTQL